MCLSEYAVVPPADFTTCSGQRTSKLLRHLINSFRSRGAASTENKQSVGSKNKPEESMWDWKPAVG